MLRGIEAPTDFESKDKDPSIPAAGKLTIIAASPVTYKPWVINGKVYEDNFSVTLPYVDGAWFATGLRSFPNCMLTEHVNVGDAELYGHGIGSRLLRAATRHAVERNTEITYLTTGWARLGLVNAAVKVYGIENVAVHKNGIRYGWQSDRALDEVFDDTPPVPGKKYLVYDIHARIDRDVAMTWEAPVLRVR